MLQALIENTINHHRKVMEAIRVHHSQKADDRCIEDDDKLYAAAGLPPCDRDVGSKEAMLHNCKRFIENRCTGEGKWPTYVELEQQLEDKNHEILNWLNHIEMLKDRIMELEMQLQIFGPKSELAEQEKTLDDHINEIGWA